MKYVAKLLLFILFLVITSSQVLAVETVLQAPQEFNEKDPIELTVTINGAREGQNFLKAEFFKKDTTSYFGQTYNGQDWYDGSDHQNYLPVQITESGWSGKLQARLGENKSIDPEGEYFIRVRRFTQSGTYNNDEAQAAAVKLTFKPQSPIQTPVPTITDTAPSPVFTAPSYSLISINEVYPHPANSENEWVELYNFNDFSVSLDNWFIDDIDGGSSPRQFSLFIGAKSYAVIELSSSILNNDGDTVRLLDSLKNTKDTLSFESSSETVSFGRQSFTEKAVCLQSPSKGTINSSCITPTSAPLSPTKKTEPTTGFLTANLDDEDYTDASPTITPLTLYSKVAALPQKTNTLQNIDFADRRVLGTSDQKPDLWLSRAVIKGFAASAFVLASLNCVYVILKLKQKGYLPMAGISV